MQQAIHWHIIHIFVIPCFVQIQGTSLRLCPAPRGRRDIMCPLTRLVPRARPHNSSRQDKGHNYGEAVLYCNSGNAAGYLQGLVSTGRLFHLVRTDDPHRTLVAPNVVGVPGAIHKKYKTHAEAREAFDRAMREGTVRPVPVDPGSDTASSSDSPFPPRVARDNRQRQRSRRQHRTQGHYGHEVERPAPAPALRPATRLQSNFRRERATSAAHPNIIPSAHAGPSGIAERMDRITLGSEPQDRLQNFNQESRITLEYVANGSPSSRPARLSTRGRSHERWQGGQYRPVDAPRSSSRAVNSHMAIPHHEARPMSTSGETRRRSCEGPDATLLQPAGSSYSTHGDSRLTLGVPGNATHTDGTPPRFSPRTAEIGRTDIEPEGLIAFLSTDKPLANTPLDFDPAYTPGSPIALSRAYGEGDGNGNGRARIQSFDAYPDPFDWSEIREYTFCQGTTIITDVHPGLPDVSRPASVCSHISLASSAESFSSVMSFDIHVEAVETSESPGRSAHVVGPAPQRAVSPLAISDSVEDRIPGRPTQSQQCLNDEENVTNALTTTPPLGTPTDDSRSFGFLVDATTPLTRTHSSQVDRQCLGQGASEDCPDLSRSPSPLVVPCTTSRSTTHPLTHSSHLSLIDISASSPCRALPPLSTLPSQPHIDQEVSVSPEVIGLGLSIEDEAVPSSQRHALPHRTTSRSSPRILADRPAGSHMNDGVSLTRPNSRSDHPTEEQSPTRDHRSRWDAHMSQGQTPPSLPGEVAFDHAPSGETRSMNGAAPSPRNVPLPSSPPTPGSATSGTSTHLQAQPSHRSSPNHPFYPSLAGDDDTSDRQSSRARLSPSGVHFALRLPTLGLTSVIQVPALIRSPLTHPHSPIHLDADTGCRRRRTYHGVITVACFFFLLHSFICLETLAHGCIF